MKKHQKMQRVNGEWDTDVFTVRKHPHKKQQAQKVDLHVIKSINLR